MRQEKSSLLRNKGFQSLLASLLCIVLGLLIGYIVLLIINPAGAGEAIRTIVENFLYYPSAAARLRYLGNTLVKTAPLLMCSLSVLFAYKVGLFNIGAPGQYLMGTAATLILALTIPTETVPAPLVWLIAFLGGMLAGALWGCIPGLVKAFLNINEVLACIMTMDEYKDLREHLGLNQDSKVLLFSTEGDTDPERYKAIVWEGKER